MNYLSNLLEAYDASVQAREQLSRMVKFLARLGDPASNKYKFLADEIDRKASSLSYEISRYSTPIGLILTCPWCKNNTQIEKDKVDDVAQCNTCHSFVFLKHYDGDHFGGEYELIKARNIISGVHY